MTVLENNVSTLLNDYIEEKEYNYNHHFILHSFDNEFIVKLYLYPKYENNRLSHVANIYLSKEKKIIRLKSLLTNELIDVDDDNEKEHLNEILIRIVKEYRYLTTMLKLNSIKKD